MQEPIKERIAKLRREIAQIREANRLYLRDGKKIPGAVADHERRLQRLQAVAHTVQGLRVANKHVALARQSIDEALDHAGIICNYNTVPYDPRKPFNPSGIRLGTPAVTSRAMGEDQMRQIARWMDQVIAQVDDEAAIGRIGEEVRSMSKGFPAPGIALDD